MPHHRPLLAVTSALALLGLPVPAQAAASQCGTVKGVGSGISVTKVATTSGGCAVAKTTAKAFAKTRVAPKGYRCKETFTAMQKANVTCTRTGRKITFKVVWTSLMPLPAAQALPSANAG
jgi:hypothetical protein